MSDKKPKQKKKEKEKPYFHKTSDAGKGDAPRNRNITQEERGEKWEKIFKPKKEKEDKLKGWLP